MEQSSGIKNAGLAAVLSAIWVGAGQLYNGQIGKGITMMICWVGLITVAGLIAGAIGGLLFLVNPMLTLLVGLVGVAIVLVYWVWGIRDAYRTAKGTAA